MTGFVGGDAEVVAHAGRRLSALGRELGAVGETAGSHARRAAHAAGDDGLAAALDGWSASWVCGLSVLAAHVVAVAVLAQVGGADLARLAGADGD